MNSNKNRIAYLLNTYPYTSATFIRREIRNLEREGLEIHRFAIRKWQEELVEQSDKEELDKTHFILTNNYRRLIINFFLFFCLRPIRFLRISSLWFTLFKNSGYVLIKSIAYLLEAVYLVRELERLGVSHIHCHYSNNATSVALISSALSNITYSFTVHGPDELDRTVQNSLDIKVAQAEFVVAISDFCKSQIVRHCHPEHTDKVKVVRCGLDLEAFPANHKRIKDRNRILCIGRLCPQKNQLLLLEAFEPVLRVRPNLKLDFVGDGPSRSRLERRISDLGLASSVSLLGWLDESDVREALNEASIMVLPSSAEGLPIVLMEAIACRTPVLSTYIAGIPELIRNNNTGWLVPASNSEKLSEQLNHILGLSNQDIEKVTEAAYEKLKSEHDIKDSTKELFCLFEVAAH